MRAWAVYRAIVVPLAVLGAPGSALAMCFEADHSQVAIYPTADLLPENLLRMYVYFPRPMGADEGLRSVRLLGEQGVPINGVFLAGREDLWSSDRRRLTLVFDPGRVKTGLAAHQSMGRALAPGRSYTLDVSGAALDATGCPLGADTRFGFTVVDADYDPPDPAAWEIAAPAANSTEPVVVTLGSAHDHVSLAFRLRVLDVDGAVVPGKIVLGDGEESWEFAPRAPWAATTYTLSIDERLEDLAGNRPGVPFDRPLRQAPRAWIGTRTFTPQPTAGEP
ncbi:MAG: hypothetical protein AAFV87_15660 [Pseudomonadota bacterium]